MLKKMIPPPVLKAALGEMSMDWQDDDIFEASDDDEKNNMEGIVKKKGPANKEPYAGSLFFKAGKSAASSLYYVDHNKIKEMRCSIQAYMLVAINRFTDQCHMWILQNFVMEYKQDYISKLDLDFSPNSDTAAAREVKSRMEEKPSDIMKRRNTNNAIRKIKVSLDEIDQVNRE